IQSSDPQGDVTVTGTASGYVIPTVSVNSLQSRLRGLDSDTARRLIETVAPGSVVEIRLAPAPAPWLPLTAGHITIVVVAANPVPMQA
ncbi:MAG: hypothetical protein QOI23_693, partial [Chloroflexota bacterium]|nr:hypothetical protein [Chloroflexota bacterium]